MARSGKNRPTGLTLCAYNVGFGDCMLLTVHYPKAHRSRDRHVLIDFGWKAKPENAPRDLRGQIAEDIRRRCKGKLDILVVTHRHQDHLSGFATNKAGTASGDVIRALEPAVILLPWTEDPQAATDAEHATATVVKRLAAMQAYAGRLGARASSFADLDPAVAEEFKILGEDGLTNKNALNNIHQRMASGTTYYYCDAETKLKLGRWLPGVEVYCLGPPNLVQAPHLHRHGGDEGYWELTAQAVGAEHPGCLEEAESIDIPPHLRESCTSLRKVRVEQQLSIVRELDRALNNTSLILVFKICGRTLLFSGDAEHENWKYALSKEDNRSLLRGTDLYKVGHHASHNATPKALWELFDKRSTDPDSDRMWTVLSTKKDVFNEVPKPSLVEALKANTDLYDTEELKLSKGELCWELYWPLS